MSCYARWLRVTVLLLAASAMGTSAVRADDWPQWLGPQRDGIWRESGLLEKFPDGGPKVIWRKPLGTGYAGPAVADGRVFVMDLERAVDENGVPLRATRQGIPGSERVLCLDSASGEPVWKHEYDCPYTISYPNGPRTTPVIDEGPRVHVGCDGRLALPGRGRRQGVLVEEAHQGLRHRAAGVGLCVAPARRRRSACIRWPAARGAPSWRSTSTRARKLWRALSSEEVGYSPPMIYELAGKRQLVVWLSEAIYGLDPATGQEYWKAEYPQGVPVQRPSVNIITVKAIDDLLFVSTFYHGPMMLQSRRVGRVAGLEGQQQLSGQAGRGPLPDGLAGVRRRARLRLRQSRRVRLL